MEEMSVYDPREYQPYPWCHCCGMKSPTPVCPKCEERAADDPVIARRVERARAQEQEAQDDRDDEAVVRHCNIT